MLLLYFLNSPVMFLSMVNHWPVECQRTSPTSRKLVREHQLLAAQLQSAGLTDLLAEPPPAGTNLGDGCMSLGFTWLKTCISFWAALCCWISYSRVRRAG